MKISKKILSVVLVLALTLSLFGTIMVSADAAVSFDVYEEVADEEAGVNTLVFKASVPAGKYGSCGLLFSFDNTKVQLVDYETYEPVEENTDGTYYALEPINKWDYASTKTKVTEGRTYVKADAYYAKGTTLSSAGELEFTKVYFKYKDGAKPSKDTFKLETEYKDGSWLKECYPNANDSTAAAISVFDSGSAITYTYLHVLGTDNNPIAVNSFEHAGTQVSNVREVPNSFVNMPDEAFYNEISSVGGSGEYFSIVVPNATAEKMGIDISKIAAPTTTEGTAYDGLYMKGHIYLSGANWVYTVAGEGEELTSKQKEANAALLHGPVDINFDNLKITRIRTNGAKTALVLEAKRTEIVAAITSAQKYAGTIDLASLTETTTIPVEKVDYTGDIRSDFLLYSDPYWVNNFHLYTGPEYKENIELDVTPFTADTLFLSMDTAHVYGDAIPAKKWETTTQLGWNFWWRTQNAGQGDDTGPYQVVVPKVSGEYKVYGLKYGHGTSNKRAKVDVNGNHYSFNSLSGTGTGAWAVYWDVPTKTKGEDTVTLTAGVPVFVGDITYKGDAWAQGALLAVAFVPVDEAESINLDTTNNAIAEMISATNIDALNTVDFGANLAKTYNITLKDSTEGEGAEVAYGAKPYFRRNQATGSAAWPYEGNSMVGHPTGYATAADLMTQFLMETKGMTEDEAWNLALKDTYQMYVNGIREYRVNQKLILPGDVVEIKKEAVTSANFNPLPLGSYINGSWYASGANVRFGLKAGDGFINKDTYPHLYTGIYYGYGNANNIKGTYPTDTYFAGFMIRQTGDYAGQKVYFPMAKLASKNNDVSTDASQFLPNVEGYTGSNVNQAIDNTINVTTPEGEKTVLNPYVITNGNGVSAAYYNAGGLYWVNSSTTCDVRYENIDGEYVLRTDGFVMVRVVTKKADGSVKTVRTELTPGKSYVFKPVAGETVYVWEDTPYNGTTMVPLLAPFTVE